MTVPATAMVLAAGLGKRMRPITDTMPKPLVRIRGRTLLDHAIDRLVAAHVETIVVNAHYRAEQIVAHLGERRFGTGHAPRITISEEPELLETGGGVRKALPLLGEHFYVVNADIFWLDSTLPALARLVRAWDASQMDALLLLQRTTTAIGYDGSGDYYLDPLAAPPRRRADRAAALCRSADPAPAFVRPDRGAVHQILAHPALRPRARSGTAAWHRPRWRVVSHRHAGRAGLRRRAPCDLSRGALNALMRTAQEGSSSHRASLFTIAVNLPFLDTLVAGLRAETANDALALSRITILLPTRRACRALREAFLRASDGRALLLPRMRPLGDLDDDELSLT